MDNQKPTRFRSLLWRVREGIIQPVPPELDACEDCGRLECKQAEWATCEHRIARAERLQTLRASQPSD